MTARLIFVATLICVAALAATGGHTLVMAACIGAAAGSACGWSAR